MYGFCKQRSYPSGENRVSRETDDDDDDDDRLLKFVTAGPRRGPKYTLRQNKSCIYYQKRDFSVPSG